MSDKNPPNIEQIFKEIGELLNKERQRVHDELQKQHIKQAVSPQPTMYKLVLLNDNDTNADAVVDMLIDVFYFSYDKAAQIMGDAHQFGQATIAKYSHDVAHTKYAIIQDYIETWNHHMRIEIQQDG